MLPANIVNTEGVAPVERTACMPEARSFVEMLARPAWQADGLCLEYPHINFFPERGEDATPAKRVCHKCLVRRECLAWALEQHDVNHLAGIWGGSSSRDRRRILAGTLAAPRPPSTPEPGERHDAA